MACSADWLWLIRWNLFGLIFDREQHRKLILLGYYLFKSFTLALFQFLASLRLSHLLSSSCPGFTFDPNKTNKFFFRLSLTKSASSPVIGTMKVDAFKAAYYICSLSDASSHQEPDHLWLLSSLRFTKPQRTPTSAARQASPRLALLAPLMFSAQFPIVVVCRGLHTQQDSFDENHELRKNILSRNN